MTAVCMYRTFTSRETRLEDLAVIPENVEIYRHPFFWGADDEVGAYRHVRVHVKTE